MEALGVILFIIGAAGMDSENIILPAVLTLIGVTLVILKHVIEEVRR